MTYKDVAFAVLAFLTPVVLWFGGVAAVADPKAVGGTKLGLQGAWTAVYFAAPFIGYTFIALPVRRWRSLDRSTRALLVGMSVLYWLIYIPALYRIFIDYAMGRAGGI